MPEACPHCEALREEIAYLRGELALDFDELRLAKVRIAFGLTPQAGRVLLILFARKRPVSNALNNELMPSDRNPESNNLDVYVCRLRKQLGKDAIQTVPGQGYRLTDAGRAKVEAALA